MTPLIQKLRSAGEAERTLAPASGLFDAAADEIERLMDRVAILDRACSMSDHSSALRFGLNVESMLKQIRALRREIESGDA